MTIVELVDKAMPKPSTPLLKDGFPDIKILDEPKIKRL